MINWLDISYLKTGSQIQQQVYRLIKQLGVMEMLSEFLPVLVGTFPIGINIPGSDLDIICEFSEWELFADSLQNNFADQKGFTIQQKQIRGELSVIARFVFKDFKFEVFGQAVPVEQQYAYRHMLIEHKLLQLNDESFRQQIIELKIKGLSTEEAFAKVLKIEGDPYLSLLDL